MLFAGSVTTTWDVHGQSGPTSRKHVCHSLVIALVVSSLDFCNALLQDLPEYQLTRLQKIHNRAARLVVFTPVSSHITPVLEQLHWLTVRQRIVFKVLVFIYKALHDLAPEYLSHLLHPRTRNPRLRQLHDRLQPAVTPASISIGRRGFDVTGPIIWNELSLTLRDAPSLALFKRHLKTYLFKRTYGAN